MYAIRSYYDRYYQIVKCFRDEDLRADRQPEFTQIDMELSFMDEEQIIDITEGMIAKLFKDTLDIDVAPPFKRITYDDAMDRFGMDRPDTRFGFELVDLTEIAKTCSFKVFRSIADGDGTVRAINARGCATFSRKDLDVLTDYVAQFGAKGLAWVKMKADGEWQSPIAKFFSDEERVAMTEALAAEEGDLLFFGARNNFVQHTLYEVIRLKSQMKQANKAGAGWVLIIGEDELEKGVAMLRNMATKEQNGIAIVNDNNELLHILIEQLTTG